MRRFGYVACLAAAGLTVQAAGAGNAVGLKPTLARAAAYLELFEREFALVVSDEDYHQQIGGAARPGDTARVRDTRAEMVFLWVEHEQLWITARHVQTVDGQALAGSDDTLAQLLDDEDGRVRRLRRMRTDTARFNIGDVVRNFNDPTFALQFLDRRLQRRFRWRLGAAAGDGQTGWLEFEERERPTLVRGGGESLPATGSILVNTETGEVLETRVRIVDRARRTDARIEVTFAAEPRLPVRVPATMTERYESQRQEGAGRRARWIDNEPILARARYSNFRRFETSGRLLR